MYLAGKETRRCPAEFQQRLTRMFGVSPFGDPLFKIVWGASEFVRVGNVWRDKQGTERKGIKERYLCHGMPCWNIIRWRSAKEYGSETQWYEQTWDRASQMHSLGEYPWRGRYEIVQPLMWTEYSEGKIVTELVPCVLPGGRVEEIPVRKVVGRELIVHHMPLSHLLIDEIIPMLVQIERMSKSERKAAEEMCRTFELRKKQREITEISEGMMENLPRSYGPVSFSGQGCRTSLLDRKMEAIQKAIVRVGKQRLQKGFHAGTPVSGRV